MRLCVGSPDAINPEIEVDRQAINVEGLGNPPPLSGIDGGHFWRAMRFTERDGPRGMLSDPEDQSGHILGKFRLCNGERGHGLIY